MPHDHDHHQARHADASRTRLLTRIRRIRGQAEAIERAVAAGTDEGALLQQIAAVRGAVNGLLATALEQRIRRHEHGRVPAARHQEEHAELIRLLRTCLQ